MSDLPDIVKRLQEEVARLRGYVTNGTVVMDLLQPEMDKFEKRTGHNIYAVRMFVDHKSSVRKDKLLADDIEKAIECITIAGTTALIEVDKTTYNDVKGRIMALSKDYQSMLRSDGVIDMNGIGLVAEEPEDEINCTMNGE